MGRIIQKNRTVIIYTHVNKIRQLLERIVIIKCLIISLNRLLHGMSSECNGKRGNNLLNLSPRRTTRILIYKSQT